MHMLADCGWAGKEDMARKKIIGRSLRSGRSDSNSARQRRRRAAAALGTLSPHTTHAYRAERRRPLQSSPTNQNFFKILHHIKSYGICISIKYRRKQN